MIYIFRLNSSFIRSSDESEYMFKLINSDISEKLQ